MHDLTGQTFNNLTILTRISNFEGRKRTYYNCECICGNKTFIEGSKLLNGHTKSCGCLKIKKFKGNTWSRKGYGEALENRIYQSYKDNAKYKNIIFNLTKQEVLKFFQQKCFYCGIPPNKTITKKNFYGSFTYNGIDRLNNDIGYIKENCVSCCSFCNYTKNKTDFKDFINWIRKVAKNTKHIKVGKPIDIYIRR